MPVDADDSVGCLGLLAQWAGFIVFDLFLERRWFRFILYALGLALIYGLTTSNLEMQPSHRAGLWFLVGFLFLIDLGFGLAKLQRGDRFWS